MKEGYLYILANEAFPRLLKIGATGRLPEKRAAELSRATGVPSAYLVRFEAKVSDWRAAESIVHRTLDLYRYNKNREFFKLDLSTAIENVSEIASNFRLSSPQFNFNFNVSPRRSECKLITCDKCRCIFMGNYNKCPHCGCVMTVQTDPNPLDSFFK